MHADGHGFNPGHLDLAEILTGVDLVDVVDGLLTSITHAPFHLIQRVIHSINLFLTALHTKSTYDEVVERFYCLLSLLLFNLKLRCFRLHL